MMVVENKENPPLLLDDCSIGILIITDVSFLTVARIFTAASLPALLGSFSVRRVADEAPVSILTVPTTTLLH